jgi:hypothetical protein
MRSCCSRWMPSSPRCAQTRPSCGSIRSRGNRIVTAEALIQRFVLIAPSSCVVVARQRAGLVGAKLTPAARQSQFSVERRQTQQICVRFLGRNPPPKHHTTLTRHREQVAIPRWLRRITGERAVRAVIVNELLKVSEEREHPDEIRSDVAGSMPRVGYTAGGVGDPAGLRYRNRRETLDPSWIA